MAAVRVNTLRRAVAIAGGEQELALLLKVTPSHLALWVEGVEAPPGDVFLRAVDLVTDYGLAQLSASSATAEEAGASTKSE